MVTSTRPESELAKSDIAHAHAVPLTMPHVHCLPSRAHVACALMWFHNSRIPIADVQGYSIGVYLRLESLQLGVVMQKLPPVLPYVVSTQGL